MKIAIDIDDEDYKRIQGISDVFNSLISRAYSAIRNGASLPDTYVGDLISRQAAIDAIDVKNVNKGIISALQSIIEELPSAQPTEASCWGCNCPKMERLKEQKTFSEMVRLHDAETHEERTETHACDCISREAALEILDDYAEDIECGSW